MTREWTTHLHSFRRVTDVPVARQRVVFSSFASASSLPIEDCDLVVCDSSSIHPRAAKRVAPTTSAVGHDGYISARFRLFLSLSPPVLTEAALPTAIRSEETECIVSAAGSTCFGASDEDDGAAAASRAAEAAAVCRRVTTDDGGAARLAIIAAEIGLIQLMTPAALRAALEPLDALGRIDAPMMRLATAQTQTVELALAVLYAFLRAPTNSQSGQ